MLPLRLALEPLALPADSEVQQAASVLLQQELVLLTLRSAAQSAVVSMVYLTRRKNTLQVVIKSAGQACAAEGGCESACRLGRPNSAITDFALCSTK